MTCSALQEIIVGRPRDGSDRVSWLLEHSRFEQALDIIESDVTLSQATREQACSLKHSVSLPSHTDVPSMMPLLTNTS